MGIYRRYNVLVLRKVDLYQFTKALNSIYFKIPNGLL